MGRFTFAPIDSMTHRPPLHHQVPLHKHNWPSPCSPTDVHQSSLEKTCLVRVFFLSPSVCIRFFALFVVHAMRTTYHILRPKNVKHRYVPTSPNGPKHFSAKGGKTTSKITMETYETWIPFFVFSVQHTSTNCCKRHPFFLRMRSKGSRFIRGVGDWGCVR